MTQTTSAAGPKRSLGARLVRRGAIAIALVLLMLIPAFGFMAATGQPAWTYTALATIIGLVAVVAGGLRIGVITAVVVALLAPLAVVAGLTPVTGAALMALMTMTVGRLATFGLHRATMLVPILMAWPLLAPVPWLPHDRIDELNGLLAKRGMTLSDALTTMGSHQGSSSGGSSGPGSDAMARLLVDLRMDTTYLTALVAIFFIGAILPVAIAWILRRRLPAPRLTMHPRRETVPYTVTIAVLASVATYYFLSNPSQPGGAFLIAVILVLTQVGNDIAWRLTLERVLGTLAGVGLFIGVNAIVGTTTYVEFFGLPFPLEIYLIGTVFGIVAIMAKFSPRAWIYYIFIVPTTAYLNAFSVGQAAGLGKARLVDNTVGAVLVIAAAIITLGASRLYSRRFPADQQAPIPVSPA